MFFLGPAHPLFTLFLLRSRSHRDAIELEALVGKTKATRTQKEGANSPARNVTGAAMTTIPPTTTALDPATSSASPPPLPRPPTGAAAAAAAANPLPAAAPSLRSLLECNRPRPPPDTLSQLELAVARFEALVPSLPPPRPLSALCPGVYKKGRSGDSTSRFSQQQWQQQHQHQPTQKRQQTQGSHPNASFSDAGCGAPLEPCSYRAAGREGGGAGTLVHSWRCSTRPRCSYQETPPERIAAPRLALEVVLAVNFKNEEEEKTTETETPTTTKTPTTTETAPPLHRCLVPPPSPPSYELLVAPSRGAEDCVTFCGGVGAVLSSLGLRGLVLQSEESAKAAKAAAAAREKKRNGDDAAAPASASTTPTTASAPPSLSLRLPLGCYERLEARLLAARVARAPVLPASGRVPPGVLSALRGDSSTNNGASRARAARPGPAAAGRLSAAASATAAAEDESESNEESVESLFAKIPLPLAASLLPFQREGVAFALRAGGRALNCDEMGVGKTLQAVAAVAAYRDEWPALVVCPASLRLAWAEEAERWLSGVLRPSRVAVVDGAASALGPGDSPDLAITSFEMLARRSCASCTRDSTRAAVERGASNGGGRSNGVGGNDNYSSNAYVSKPSTATSVNGFVLCPGRAGGCMAGRGWRVLVVDESHVLRTGLRGPPDARATEAAVAAAARARRAVFLTGTPSLSKPFDLWRQVDALVPGLLPVTRDAFAARYCGRRLLPLFGFSSSNANSKAGGSGSGVGGSGMTMSSNNDSNKSGALSSSFSSYFDAPPAPMRVDVSGLSHGRDLAAALRRAVMVRRLKSDVCGQLPPRRRQVVLLPRPRPGDWRRLSRAAAERNGGVEGGRRGGGGVGGAVQPVSSPLPSSSAAAATRRKGGGQRQQQQRAPPPPAFSLAELAASREKKQSKKKAKRSNDDDCEEALAFLGGSGDNDDDEREDFVDLDDDEYNQDRNRPFQLPDPRSDAHRTALAKLPAAIEWLSTVFGCGGAGASSAAASNYSSAVATSQAPSNTSSSSSSSPTTKQQELPNIIIFAHHRDVMDALASALVSFGIRYVRIDGSVDGADRRAAVEAFRDGAGGVRAALLSVTAAGTGLDFASASSVVFAELPDEPALVRQEEDRSHRRGREGGGGKGGGFGMPLNVYFLIAKGTSDERRWRALDDGLQRVAEALAEEGAAKGSGRRPSQLLVSQTPLTGYEGRHRRRFGCSFGGGGGDARGLAVDRIREVHTQAATQAAAAAAAASLLAAVRAPPDTLDGGSTPAPSSQAAAATRSAATKSSSSLPAAGAPPPSPDPGSLPLLPAPGSAANANSALINPALAAAAAAAVFEQRAASEATPAAEATAAVMPRTVSPADENNSGDGNPESRTLASFPPFPRLVWFELSPHTSRLHLHGSPDGTAPLGLSVPLETMAAASSSSSDRSGSGGDLDGAVAVLSSALVAPGGPCCPATDRPPPPRETLAAWARDARELAGELIELRGVLRARFAAGNLLRPPLTMVVAAGGSGKAGATTTAATAAAAAEENDGSGRGTIRHDAPRAPLPEVLELLLQVPERQKRRSDDGGNDSNPNVPLPRHQHCPPYSLLEVHVAAPEGQLRTYLQVFDARGRGLCLDCGAPTPCQLPSPAPLSLRSSSSSSSRPSSPSSSSARGVSFAGGGGGGGRSLLFCGGRCDASHAARTSAARAALFRAERGVCCACGLDCHSLVRDLRAIGKESGGGGCGDGFIRIGGERVPWRLKRLALILSRAPSFRGARAAAAAARLASSAVEGHAWQADHVLAVHRGGGACGVGNLRTLCVPCHAEVTAAQARERARLRRREKRRRKEGGGGGEREEDEENEDGDDAVLPNGPPAGLQRALLLHARMGAAPRFIEDDDDDEEDEGDEEEESDDEEEDERPPAAAAAAAAASAFASVPRPLAGLAAMAGAARQQQKQQPQQQGKKRSK